MIVELRDGRRLDSGAMQASGDPARPMTYKTEREKFRTLTGTRFGARFARLLEATVDALAEPNVSESMLCERVLNAPPLEL